MRGRWMESNEGWTEKEGGRGGRAARGSGVAGWGALKEKMGEK